MPVTFVARDHASGDEFEGRVPDFLLCLSSVTARFMSSPMTVYSSRVIARRINMITC